MGQTIEGYSTSPQQRRLWCWFTDRAPSACDSRCILLLEGTVSPNRLKQALEATVHSNEILRTRLQVLRGMNVPAQIITDEDFCWADLDTNTGPKNMLVVTSDLLEQNGQLSDHVGSWRPLRVSFAQLEPGRAILLLYASAFCADGRTLRTLIDQIVHPSVDSISPGHGMQYADIAEILNKVTENKLGRAYWREEMEKCLEGHAHLPMERKDGGRPFEVRRMVRAAGEGIARGLREFSGSEGLRVQSVLLACWESLLRRWAGGAVLLGCSFDGRTYEGTEDVLGPFARYLPVRWNSRQESLSEASGRLQEWMQEAAEWQECFEWEERWGEGYFPYCFDYEEWPEVWECGTTRFRVLEQYACIDRFRLRLNWVRQGERWRAAWDWDPSYYTKEDVERLAEGYEALLEQALEQPETMVGALEAVGAREKRRVTEAFNETAVEFGEPQSLSERFERQVGRTPKEIAVSDERRSYSYEELNRRANRVRNYLWKQGMGPESLVGICMERSADLMAALLGVLKAGAAYVPLDPGYPAERLRFMLSDAGVELVLTERVMAGALPIEYAGRRVNVEEIWEASDESAEQNQVSGAGPENAAYVIYTSGSTGQPKGVVISQAAICNHMDWIGRRAVLSAQDRVLQKTPYNFDASVWEFYAPLEAGAQLVMARPGGHQDAQYLVEIMARERITVVQMVPSQLRMVLEEPGFERCRWLRRVYCGGEALERSLVERFQERTGAELENLYGPTEATIDAVSWVCGRDEQGVVPIGTPIANVQAYVLDQELQTVPVGVSGELYLGGVGLARGYLKRPQLTAERFLPNPWNANGGRLYRTGDVARWRSDGVLEYVGRSDSQVKLRGYRIELGEIESLLRGHEAVSEAIAVVREENPGNALLLAYVVGKERVVLDKAELLVYLRQQLPDYMVPSILMVLDRLPLTPHGKIDRKALPTPERSGNNTIPQRPRTPVEDVLVNIWEDVLGLPDLGLQENFFDLGGHSLLATQVISRVREAFHVEVPLATLFEYPTVTALGTQIERSLRAGQLSEVPPLRSAPRDHPLPLSFAQQRLWFLDQFTPGSTVYNMPSATRLRGRLDVRSLAASLNTIVQRHEVLRTSFPAGPDGQPFQAIAPSLELPLNLIDLSALPEQKREEECLHLVQTAFRKPFDLSQGPLVQTLLLRIDDEEHVLVFVTHHIVYDRWSVSVLIRELTELYESHLHAAPPQLSPLPIQYADYALWQRECMKGEVLEQQIAYWRQTLNGAPPLLTLPTDYPRPAVQTFCRMERKFVLASDVLAGISRLSRDRSVTLFMTLLAAYAVLLHRYSGQSRIVIGVPVSTRNSLETEPLIGLFLNTLPVYLDFNADPTFESLLAIVREAVLGAYTHQQLPFEKLVEELQPERSTSYTPIFQVAFDFENLSRETLRLGAVSITPVAIDNALAKFDLSLALSNTGSALAGSLVFDTALFKSGTGERLVNSFEVLVKSAVAEPHQRVSRLPLITEAEKRRVTEAFNETAVEFGEPQSLSERFERQVGRTPKEIAVSDERRSYSYEELNRRANRVRNYLWKQGMGPESLVGICMERSADLMAALLGVLKAGAAYVPLDPGYPAERLRFMLSDAGVELVLTERVMAGALPIEYAGRRVNVEEIWEASDESAEQNQVSGAGPENAAYVIYTSGSTGQPKGVVISQAAICNHMDWIGRRAVLSAQDRVLQKTPYNFDASVWEFYAPLEAGAQLVMARPGGHQDAQYLVEIMARERITVVQMVPSQLRMVLEEPGFERCRWLRRVYCGGEALERSLVERFQERTGAELENLYGPTEATIDAVSWVCGRDEQGVVPIGTPIANVQAYVLDQELQTVPVGVSGELYLGGVGLARGYLKRPQLTAERFLPNPWNANGGRLYRTGDVARWRSDGVLEYVGRSDSQVKLRGYRIELGEIESLLRGHEAVSEAIAVVREENPGNALLLAYVVGKERVVLDKAELLVYLRQQLPDYMVPSILMVLDRLPLTPHGKIDRKALPTPERSGNNTIPQRPRTPVEDVLVNIWEDVLGLPDLGLQENFFDLGGHSLLAMEMVLDIRQQLHVEMPLCNVFETPTVAGLATHVETGYRSGQAVEIPPIFSMPHGDIIAASPVQQRMWRAERGQSDMVAYHFPARMRVRGVIDIIALESALNEVIRRHEILRTTFHEDVATSKVMQMVQQPFQLRIPVLDISHLRPEEREPHCLKLALEEAKKPFNLATGPLLRATIISYDGQEHILLFTAHRMVYDGWSAGILIRELGNAYVSFLSGSQPQLPDVPFQYADYATWQQEWIEGEGQESLAYWRKLFYGMKGDQKASLSNPDLQPRTHWGRSIPFTLSHDLTNGLKALSRREGMTLFTPLLSALGILLYFHSAEQTITIVTPVAGRFGNEMKRVIGPFSNPLPLQIPFSKDSTFSQVLATAQKSAYTGYQHQALPIEAAADALHRCEQAPSASMFSTAFVFEDAPREALRLPGLCEMPFIVEEGPTQFDLTMEILEHSTHLRGNVIYDCSYYHSEEALRFTEDFEAILKAVLQNPSLKVHELKEIIHAS